MIDELERLKKKIIEDIKGDFFIIVDGGARNGTKEVPNLHPLSLIFAFEPNTEEFNKLQNVMDGDTNFFKPGTVINYPVALVKDDKKVILNISLRSGATSTLYPDADFLSHFKEDNWHEISEIINQIEVPGMRLDTFMKKNGISYIDLLKLDTQGNELDILISSGEFIDTIEVIKAEVEFAKIYKGQPLFFDVSKFLYDNGFELIDFQWSDPCRRFHYREDLEPNAYRLIWADAIFARRPYDFNKPRLLAQAIILAEMGYKDLALYQIINSKLSLNEKKVLEKYYLTCPPKTIKRRIKDFIAKNYHLKIERYNFIKKQVKSVKHSR